MFYIIETDYCGPNVRDDKYADEHYYDVTTKPGRTNMSNEECIAGWLGTTNDWYYYAHGEYETEDEAKSTLTNQLLNGQYREVSDEIDSFDREEYGIIARYKPGRYEPWGPDATGSWIYEGIRDDIFAQTTDEEIEELLKSYIEEARREVDAELDRDTI